MSHTAFPDTDIAVADTDAVGDVVADFVAAARDWPHRAAIVHNGSAITYRDLAERVRLTALRYRVRGFGADGPSGLIGALVSHTPAVVEHLLGILQARATYCPIDAALPVARKQALAAALGVDRLFTAVSGPARANEPADRHARRGPSSCEYRTAAAFMAPERSGVCAVHLGFYWGAEAGGGLAACLNRHGARAARPLRAHPRGPRAPIRLAGLGHLLRGDLARADRRRDTGFRRRGPFRLVPALRAHAGGTGNHRTRPADGVLARTCLFLHEEQAALPDSVRVVVIGGERVDPTRLRQWRDLDVGHVRLLNTYGCTETTMVTHAVQLSGPGTEPEVAAHDEAPLGRPLPHVRDHVTDEGELLVSGPALATGYLGLPELTATGFPVADHGSGPIRWFHTGDLVTRGEHGLLYSRGRADEQVKVLGVRVHPAEVEAQLNTHPGVTGAVVVGQRLLGRTVLTAYVVSAEATTPAELKRYLRERLPSQFVPSRVKFVAALAYTASGKVDRAATRRAAADYDSKGADQ